MMAVRARGPPGATFHLFSHNVRSRLDASPKTTSGAGVAAEFSLNSGRFASIVALAYSGLFLPSGAPLFCQVWGFRGPTSVGRGNHVTQSRSDHALAVPPGTPVDG